MNDEALIRRILDEADIASRPGQYDRLIAIAGEVDDLLNRIADLRAKVEGLTTLPLGGWDVVFVKDVLALIDEARRD